jgi:hypothetical protein
MNDLNSTLDRLMNDTRVRIGAAVVGGLIVIIGGAARVPHQPADGASLAWPRAEEGRSRQHPQDGVARSRHAHRAPLKLRS